MFASPSETLAALESAGYFTDIKTATAVYLAGRINRPVLLEGPAGAGKTELAQSCAGPRCRLLRRCLRGPLRRAARTGSRHHRAGIGVESHGDFKEECRGTHATDAGNSSHVRRWESVLRNRKPRRRRSVSVGTVDRISRRYAACRCGLLLRSESHSPKGSGLSQSGCPGQCGSSPRSLPP